MKPFVLTLFLLPSIIFAQRSSTVDTTKPWTFWWVMGSTFDSTNITRQLTELQKSGIGGVHIIPIYGAKGYESKYVPFMSDKWLQYLQFACNEVNRLGLGLDLTLGTGWPFGGKFITTDYSAKKIKWQSDSIVLVPTMQKVKRAAPNGEGLVLDHFDKNAFQNYVQLTGFQKLKPYFVRALYNDSYEAFDANWTTDFWRKFKSVKGYDLKPYQRFLKTNAPDGDTLHRILTDYREVMSDLLLSDFTQPFAQFAAQQQKIIRNQAHGSPANLLDLYAASDIPETESFGSSRFDIPLVRVDANYEPDRYGRPNPFAMKFASSAAHLTGKKLVSSETCTWLANHFKVALSQIKPQIDELFTAGINHIFYHGTTYSPKEAPYPGWLFYASTNFGQNAHLWADMPALNKYVANCQQLLQHSKPDAEVLLYFPIHDLWAEKGNTKASSYPLQMLDVHHTENWLTPSEFGKTAQKLTEAGYQFDYISDRFIQTLQLTSDKKLQSKSTVYQTLVVPPTTQMPLATLQKLHQLTKQGAAIVFLKHTPQHITGWHNYTQQEREWAKIRSDFKVINEIDLPNCRREELTKYKLSYLRKRTNEGYLYFITNLNSSFERGKIKLATPAKSAILYNPLTEKRTLNAHNATIDLNLLPGQSVFVLLSDKPTHANPELPKTYDKAIPIKARWQIMFPNLPTINTDTLISWTMIGTPQHEHFSGGATYKAMFTVDNATINKEAILDLGDVRETAEILLNGKNLGKVWCVPYQIGVPANILKKENVIEIKVRNLSANEMIKIDKERPNWKSFYDINIVDIQYKPLDISTWKPEPSGILGQLKLWLQQ